MHPPPSSKPEIRRQMRIQRNALSAAQRKEAARGLCAEWELLPSLHAYREVAGYVPMHSEMDIMPIMAIMARNGAALSLPFVTEDHRMEFRRWQVGAPLTEGKYGIPTPQEGEIVIPDLILLPLLACDMEGVRLGAGGGYYDRTLIQAAYQQCYRLGVGYAFQLLPHLPSEPQDVRVQGFLSEAGFQEFGRG